MAEQAKSVKQIPNIARLIGRTEQKLIYYQTIGDIYITILPKFVLHPRQLTHLTTHKQMMEEPIYLVLYHPHQADIIMCLTLSALFAVHYTIHSTVYSTVYSVQCIVHSEKFSVCSVQCTVYSVQYTVESVK